MEHNIYNLTTITNKEFLVSFNVDKSITIVFPPYGQVLVQIAPSLAGIHPFHRFPVESGMRDVKGGARDKHLIFNPRVHLSRVARVKHNIKLRSWFTKYLSRFIRYRNYY